MKCLCTRDKMTADDMCVDKMSAEEMSANKGQNDCGGYA